MGFKMTDDEKLEVSKDLNKILTWIISHWWILFLILIAWSGALDFLVGLFWETVFWINGK